MISSFSSLRSAIIEYLYFGEGTLICNSIQTTLRLSCNYIGVFHTWRIVFAAHTQDSFLLSIIQLWGKSPETQSISLTNLNGKRPAPSTTVLGQGWQEWFTRREPNLFWGFLVPSWFHSVVCPWWLGFQLGCGCAKIWACSLLGGFILRDKLFVAHRHSYTIVEPFMGSSTQWGSLSSTINLPYFFHPLEPCHSSVVVEGWDALIKFWWVLCAISLRG